MCKRYVCFDSEFWSQQSEFSYLFAEWGNWFRNNSLGIEVILINNTVKLYAHHEMMNDFAWQWFRTIFLLVLIYWLWLNDIHSKYLSHRLSIKLWIVCLSLIVNINHFLFKTENVASVKSDINKVHAHWYRLRTRQEVRSKKTLYAFRHGQWTR